MIDRIGSETNFSNLPNTTNAKSEGAHLEFADMLADMMVSSEKPISVQILGPGGASGYVGDGQVFVCPELAGVELAGVPIDFLNDVIDILMSLTDNSESIWDIVLRLEDKVDLEALSESIETDFDNSAGLDFIAALLTRFWKKKELSGNDTLADGVDVSTYYSQNDIENKVALELEALIQKNKKQKHITAV